MLTIRNRKHQPFTFNLKEGKTLYIGPRATANILPQLLSDELKNAAQKGLVEIIGSPAEPMPEDAQIEEANAQKRRK